MYNNAHLLINNLTFFGLCESVYFWLEMKKKKKVNRECKFIRKLFSSIIIHCYGKDVAHLRGEYIYRE